MNKILFVDCDGTIREPKSGAKFIQSPDDQQIIKGADAAIARWFNEGYTENNSLFLDFYLCDRFFW